MVVMPAARSVSFGPSISCSIAAFATCVVFGTVRCAAVSLPSRRKYTRRVRVSMGVITDASADVVGVATSNGVLVAIDAVVAVTSIAVAVIFVDAAIVTVVGGW